MMVKKGGNWLSDPILCADTWSVSRDNDENVFSSFGPNDDNVMVSKSNDVSFDELKFSVPKPGHPHNRKTNDALYYDLCGP
jgi:hypothetical protein